MARSGSWSEIWSDDDIIVMRSFDSGEITADDIVRADCWGTVEIQMGRMGSL